MFVTPSFTHLSITFSNQRCGSCSPTVDVGLWSSRHVGHFLWKQDLQYEYSVLLSCHLYCRSSVIFRNNPSQCTRIPLRQCWLSPIVPLPDVVFPWFVYADVTLKTVALDTPNNVADYSQMLHLNSHQISVLFQNRTSHYFKNFSHGMSLNTITKALTRALQTVEDYSVLPTEVIPM
jgi:hypothetical protein